MNTIRSKKLISPSETSLCVSSWTQLLKSLFHFPFHQFLVQTGVVVFLLVSIPRAEAQSDPELRGWGYAEWVIAKSDRFWVDISQEERWHQNFDLHAYEESRARLNVKINSWLNASIAESYVHTRPKVGKGRHESRPALELRPHWDGEVVSIEFRERLEMREIFADGEGTTWNGRQRLQIVGSKALFPTIQPVAYDETFYDLNTGEWTQNRFLAGMRFEIADGIELAPMFGIQSTRVAANWSDAQVASISVRFNLPIF